MAALMTDPPKTQNSSIRFRKVIGRTYLHQDRLEDAVDMYLGILRDDPDDADVLLDLGNLYLASGDNRTAVKLFKRVIALDPQRVAIRKQLELAALEVTSDLPEESIPTDPEAIARMLQRLTGKRSPVTEREILRAAEMLQKIMASPNPAEEVAEHLDEIGGLLPALIELNIRQARADGQTSVAEALQNVQINIALQKSSHDPDKAEAPAADQPQPAALKRHFKGKVLVLLPDPRQMTARMETVCQSLRYKGCQVTQMGDFQAETGEPDIVIVSNPHLNPNLTQQMAVFAAKGVPVIVDLDMDYENLPVYHPDYAAKGLGRQANSKAYTAALMLASLITVPSQALADSIGGAGYPVAVLPDGWSRTDPACLRSPAAHSHISIGWVGSTGLLDDLATIRRVLLRVLNEFENTKAVIIGSAPAYQLLDTIEDSRKLFLPYTGQTDYLTLLNQVDVLLVPLRSHPSNDSLSDRILMEAGIKAIPWVASPVPAFEAWKAGGIIVRTREEWHTTLRQLIMDPNLRASLGREGIQAAGKREAKHIGGAWQASIEAILSRQAGASRQ